MNSELMHPFWQRVFRQTWILCLVLFIALGCVRGVGLLGSPSLRMPVLLNFFLMWPLLFVFFTAAKSEQMIQ